MITLIIHCDPNRFPRSRLSNDGIADNSTVTLLNYRNLKIFFCTYTRTYKFLFPMFNGVPGFQFKKVRRCFVGVFMEVYCTFACFVLRSTLTTARIHWYWHRSSHRRERNSSQLMSDMSSRGIMLVTKSIDGLRIFLSNIFVFLNNKLRMNFWFCV